jgi:uncharacterized protein YkwD
VSLPLKRLSTSLAAAVCASVVLIPPAPAGAKTPAHHKRFAHVTSVHAGCAARTARTARARARARIAVRNCRVNTHKTVAHRAQPHKVSAPSAAEVAAVTADENAAKIAAALATPCQDTELTPEGANLPLVRAATLCLVNQERARNGRVPLTPNPDLEQAAEGHCAELIADDYFAHISPSGETPVQRIEGTGYVPGPSVGYVIGENLAWGTLSLSTPQAIVSAWIASPGHLANILEAQYTETGIGVTPAVPSSLGEGESGATYAQEFGVIVR